MSNSVHLSNRVKAELRDYPSRCIALEADGACMVCWKAPNAEAQALSRPEVVISVRLIYAEWDCLDPLTGAAGDTLSLFCQAENHVYSGLARVENKQLMEDLGRQTDLKVFILNDSLKPLTIKRINWDEKKQAEARKLLNRLLKHLESEPLRHHSFVRRNPDLNARYSLSELPGSGERIRGPK